MLSMFQNESKRTGFANPRRSQSDGTKTTDKEKACTVCKHHSGTKPSSTLEENMEEWDPISTSQTSEQLNYTNAMQDGTSETTAQTLLNLHAGNSGQNETSSPIQEKHQTTQRRGSRPQASTAQSQETHQ